MQMLKKTYPNQRGAPMQVTNLEIAGVQLIVPRRFQDSRGVFSETYNAKTLLEIGITDIFVQDNVSLSTRAGTIRGLHFQLGNHAQSKLIRVSRGRILDVAVDLRRSSPTYGRHIAVDLSRENWAQLYLPIGMAHGFCTLEPDTEVVYKTSSFYAPEAEAGILWSDPKLGIRWPVKPEDAIVSEKDSLLPLFENIDVTF
jgi:dTDP-4-dehydrorhamnose 3,5-epimerase